MVVALTLTPLVAQPPDTTPPNGLRDNTPACHALTNATVITAPGRTVHRGTVVIRDGVITAVGAQDQVQVPSDARTWDCTGKTIYPGLIDAFSELPADASRSDPALAELTGSKYWNANIVPQLRADRIYKPDTELNKTLRSQGIVARLIAPSYGLLKGAGALINTSDDAGRKSILRDRVAQHVAMTIPRWRRGGAPPSTQPEDEARPYPNSPMGATALVRQALYDARWHAKAWDVHANDAATPRPEWNDALGALADALKEKLPFIVDSADELYFFRADALGKEFDLNVIVRGSGQEYRRLSEIAATKRAVIVPVNFPRPPNVATPESAHDVTLEDLMEWDLSPENPARLDKAGVRIALCTHGLRDKGTFLAAVRKAVVRGLTADAALRALTTAPAELLGVEKKLGTIEPGKSASLLITDGDLFAEKTKILETWVDGKRHEVAPTPLTTDPRGRWAVNIGEKPITLTISGELDRLTGRIGNEPATQPSDDGDDAEPSSGRRGRGSRGGGASRRDPNALGHVSLIASRLSFTIKGEPIGRTGIVQVSVNLLEGENEQSESWMGAAVASDGRSIPVTAKRTATARQVLAAQPSTRPDEIASADTTPDTSGAPPTEAQPGGTARVHAPETQPAAPRATGRISRSSTKPVIKDALFAVTYPLGDFGRDKLPDQPRAILFSNATLWTSGPDGKIENANVVVESGKITRVFRSMEAVAAPSDAITIDCAGKHLSPGLIDCHSHIATDGGVNESGQAISAEVRIGDFVNPDDINIYRQLAGGVTSSNILHGSANPIGGQNQVIKLRWGAPAEQLKFENAPPGIKFALGENVKQSNWDIPESRRTRYPQSRMGVEQLIRDEFKAAQDYRRAFKDFESNAKSKLPPRRDLELDAIAEILEHKRWIHCHSYRQDEILALIRVCDEFGIKIGSLQHILEGYKVAEAIAKHGATASSFSDWWAYKFEVYDAIPYNGAIMHDAGIVVSFNSDDAELARRLNLEAAKAVKYGAVSETEALKFVTLNPAKQLRIDDRVGSIEVGKDADIVVWSGSPLSTLSRVEQTWVDGRKYFDRAEDLKLREKQREMRTALVQRILSTDERMLGEDDPEQRERTKDLWSGEDEFCGHPHHDSDHR
jgi:N-acetylglucosamine-6-phosphate deacetylase